MGLSLEKKSELVRLNLAKRQVPENIKLAVKLGLDVSGSTQGMFRDGTMAELVDRLIPVGMRFDDNGSIETYVFSNSARRVGDITAKDFGSATTKIISEAGSVLWCGTTYSKLLEEVLSDINPKRTLSELFGAKKKPLQPTYFKFITDGDNEYSDLDRTEHLLAKLEGWKCYVQLIGIGRGSNFSQLKEWADMFDHVGFVTFPDLANTSDQAMYEALLSDELCTWIKAL